ncbi:MAG: CHAT domain-containing protein [Kouleothrix sp.]|nr:CHAT domain-containing protein [Kouleothrix sp.]
MSAPRVDQPGWQVHGNVFNVVFDAAGFAGEPRARAYLRLLAVLATPLSDARGDGPPTGRPLDVWGEWERLQEATGRARDAVGGRGVPWAMVRLAPPTPDALGRALAARDPGYQALHVSCHGTPAGLLLEDEQGREVLLPVDRLVDIVRRSGARLVVLNACESEEIARALVERAGVACAIATRSQIYEPEAVLLSDQLYGYLAAGASAGVAFDRARQAITAGISDGSLLAPGTPEERAANLLLLGDPGLTLDLDPGQEPAREPWFIRNPVPQNRELDYQALKGFVGRAGELRRLAGWLGERGRLAGLLCGVGGMGKTSLALNAALRCAWRFRAVAFASAKHDPAGWGLAHILRALNEALETTGDARDADNLPGAVAHRLNTYRVLLLLDNLETLDPPRAAELARTLRLVDPHGGSRVLMTLRPREHDPLTGLVDRRDRFEIEALDEAAALRLAWDECQRQAVTLPPAGALAPEEAMRLERLRRQAGLPATISRAALAPYDELAGLAFRHPYLLKLAAGLVADEGWDGARLRLERMRGRDVEDALQELIGRMLDALLARAPGSLAALHALLAFPGGAEEAHLRAVVTSGEDGGDDAAIDFRDSVLRPAEAAGLIARRGARYDLDPPVLRAYVERRQAPDPVVLEDYRRRQAAAMLAVVQDYDDALRAGRMTYNAPLEWANVGAALDWLARTALHDDEAARLLVDYKTPARNTLHNNYDPRLRGWLDATLAAARRLGDRLGEANVQKALGDVQQFRDERDAALESYAAALTLFRAVGSKLGEANVLAAQSRLLIDADPEQSALLLDRAITQYAAIGAVFSVGAALGNYGIALLGRARSAEASSYLQRAREIFAQVHAEQYVAMMDDLLARAQGGDDAVEGDRAGGGDA